MLLERRDFAAEMPSARFHEKENPYFLISYQFGCPATFAALRAISAARGRLHRLVGWWRRCWLVCILAIYARALEPALPL
jgi:hypothetical protein